MSENGGRKGYNNPIGKTVTVIVDRKMGSVHPEWETMVYPVNYGYVEGILAGDGEEQDVYIIGEDRPLNCFTGRVIAVVIRKNDAENKWIAAAEGKRFSREFIKEAVWFQEQYFDCQFIFEEENA